MAESADCALKRSRTACPSMNEPLIAREEVIALLFNVSDIVATLARIEGLLEENHGEEEEEADEG